MLVTEFNTKKFGSCSHLNGYLRIEDIVKSIEHRRKAKKGRVKTKTTKLN